MAQSPPGPFATDVPTIQYVLDEIQVEGNEKTSSGLVRSLSGLKTGQRIDLLDLEAVRLSLMGTGYFLEVSPKLEKSEERGHVVLVIALVERNTILLSDVFMGISRRHPFWGGLDVVEGNLLGVGLTLGGAFVVGDEQFATRLSLADPYAFSLPLRLGGSAYHAQGHEAIFVADEGSIPPGRREPVRLDFEKTGAEMGVGLYPLSLLGVFVDVGLEGIEARSDAPGLTEDLLPDGRTLHSVVRMTLDHDTRDNPLVPTAGYRLNLSLQGSSSAWGSDYDYLKLILRSAYYTSLGLSGNHVLRFDLFGGIVFGDAPFFERFFVGDVSSLVPSRDLGLSFAANGSPDFLARGADNLAYETVLAGGGVEYGVPVISGPGLVYRVEFFVGAGIFGMTTPGDLPGIRNVNLGVDLIPIREATAFPIDLTFDAGFRMETPIGIFGLSFANGLALVPF